MDSDILRDIPRGMYVIGAAADNTLTGCVVNTVFVFSANTKKAAVCVNHNSYTAACIHNTREFSVSVLTENAPDELIEVFGLHSGRDNMKFGRYGFKTIMGGLPVLTEYSAGWFHCRVENTVDAGTHVIFIAEIIGSESFGDCRPMLTDGKDRFSEAANMRGAGL